MTARLAPVAASMVCLVVAACGGAAPATSDAAAPARASTTSTTSLPVASVSPPDQPAPTGTPVGMLGYRVTIGEVVGPGVADGDAGVPATVAVTLVNETADPLDPASDLSFAIVDPDGGALRHYDCDAELGADALLDGSHLYPGGTAAGLVCFDLEGRPLAGDETVMVTGAERPLAPESTSFWVP